MKKYFLDLPIYRCSEEKFQKENENLKTFVRSLAASNRRLLNDDEKYEELVNDMFYMQSYDYDYNEITGWLKFYVEGSQIRGDWFFECSRYSKIIKERFRRGVRKKQFGFREDVYVLYIQKGDDSDTIYFNFLKSLKQLNKSKRVFRNRNFDFRLIENLGSFIDFRKLVDTLNLYNNM